MTALLYDEFPRLRDLLVISGNGTPVSFSEGLKNDFIEPVRI